MTVIDFEESCQPINEPDNHFEIGGNVMYRNRKFEIFGIKKTTLAIWQPGEFRLVKKCDVSPAKKKYELEKGDKFIEGTTYMPVEVLAVAYDEKYEIVRYLCRRKDGFVSSWSEEQVEEIIYD